MDKEQQKQAGIGWVIAGFVFGLFAWLIAVATDNGDGRSNKAKSGCFVWIVIIILMVVGQASAQEGGGRQYLTDFQLREHPSPNMVAEWQRQEEHTRFAAFMMTEDNCKVGKLNAGSYVRTFAICVGRVRGYVISVVSTKLVSNADDYSGGVFLMVMHNSSLVQYRIVTGSESVINVRHFSNPGDYEVYLYIRNENGLEGSAQATFTIAEAQ